MSKVDKKLATKEALEAISWLHSLVVEIEADEADQAKVWGYLSKVEGNCLAIEMAMGGGEVVRCEECGGRSVLGEAI